MVDSIDNPSNDFVNQPLLQVSRPLLPEMMMLLHTYTMSVSAAGLHESHLTYVMSKVCVHVMCKRERPGVAMQTLCC